MSERSGLLLHQDDKWTPKDPDARLIWAVEANTYDEALQKRDEFLERAGFAFASYSDPDAAQELASCGADKPGRHRSERSASSEQTTRVTIFVYQELYGNQQSFEVPGWIGITSDLEAHFEDIVAHLGEAAKAFPTLEQIYLERPDRDLTAMSDELTVVVLRSADGDSGMRMYQEFNGRIDDHALLAALVHRRLGTGIAGWRFVQVSTLKRGGNDEVSIPRPPQTSSEKSARAATRMPFEHSHEGVLHIVYTAHASDSDFQRIEADLDHVAKECPHLVLVMEDVLPPELFRQRLDPSLRNLPPDVLFDPRTSNRNKEEFARAYASAVSEMERAYRAWNAAPVTRKQTIFGEVSPFDRRLLAWADAHGVEIVRGETSLEAWLTQARSSAFRRTAVAAAKGDPASLWAENRKECELLSRAIQLRDADTNAQLTRLLLVERRGHDVLYVVGALHSVTEDLLVRGLKTIVHEKRILASLTVGFIEALIRNTFDDQPTAVQERLETLSFLQERLQVLARPTTSVDDVAQIVLEIDREAAARNLTLRQIVDHMITTPDFQNAASPLDGVKLRWLIAFAFIIDMIYGGFILRTEVEEQLYVSPVT
ncbi:MAG TPA: hypothetical protein VGQ36_12740 [Thermoanaerobaculia bacterium]|nr:hypothetical protein [Thermoanaerobaculia bacterium]